MRNTNSAQDLLKFFGILCYSKLDEDSMKSLRQEFEERLTVSRIS